MIQQETKLDIADNTGAKRAQCIKVLGGSTARGRFTRRTAGVGDESVCTIKRAMHLLFIAHNLERIADRVTNICERVIYLRTGRMKELDRSLDTGW